MLAILAVACDASPPSPESAPPSPTPAAQSVDLICHPPKDTPDAQLHFATPLTDEAAAYKAIHIGCWPQPGRSTQIQATEYTIESLTWAEYKPRLGETAQSFPDDDIILIVTLTGMPNADALIATLNQRTGSAFSTKTLGFKQQYLHDEVPYAQLSRLTPCGPARDDGYFGTCWSAEAEIVVRDLSGEHLIDPNHGPKGPLLSETTIKGVERYLEHFGGTALWAVVSPYNGERLPLELAESLRYRTRGQPIDAGDTHATFADSSQRLTPIPTPTPAPRNPTYVTPSESDVRARYESWRGLKFRYTDDIFVRYHFPGEPLGQALTFTLVLIEHAPSGATAQIILLDDLIEVSPGMYALPHDPRDRSSWIMDRNASEAGKAALEAVLADRGLLRRSKQPSPSGGLALGETSNIWSPNTSPSSGQNLKPAMA